VTGQDQASRHTRPVDWWFEDFEPGQTGASEPGEEYCLTREEAIAYAAEFDPQPMHLDEAAAAQSMLDGLSASGWHGCAILMRMLHDTLVGKTACQGAPGCEVIEWLRPLRPGDTYSFHWKVLDKRILKSRPDRGMIRFQLELRDQTGVTSLNCIQPIIILLKSPVTDGAAA
jgi:acyl dehydratase